MLLLCMAGRVNKSHERAIAEISLSYLISSVVLTFQFRVNALRTKVLCLSKVVFQVWCS